jgi:predicted MFS family arabinose efflux permease
VSGCSFLFTTLADSVLRRKKTLVVSLASMYVAGALTAFAPNVYAYAALRFLAGLARSVIVT